MAKLAVGQGAYGSVSTLDNITPPNQQPAPPPVPGATPTYTTRGVRMPILGMLSFGGGGISHARPQGGITVVPQPATGTVHGWAWWPDCDDPQVVRVHPDGSLNPVRGAFPLNLAGQTTRTNWCTNPSMEAGLNGYLANQGTLSTVTRTDLPADDPNVKALRCTLSAAGNPGVTVPQSLPSLTGIASLPIGFDFTMSSTPSGGLAAVVAFADGNGAAVGTVTTAVDAATLLAGIGAWSTASLLVPLPVNAVTVTSVKIIATGVASGGSLSLDRIILPGQAQSTNYGDGDTLGGSWTGTPELSVSLLAPVVQFDDGECPLDVLVSYIVACTAITGGSAETPTVQLDSGDQSWATHPSDPSHPMPFLPADGAPQLTRAANSATFFTLSGGNPRVLTPVRRQGMTGSLNIIVQGWPERDQWTDPKTGKLSDLQAILLRFPRDYGYGLYVWWSIGDTVEDPNGTGPAADIRLITLPFTEVDAPEVIQL